MLRGCVLVTLITIMLTIVTPPPPRHLRDCSFVLSASERIALCLPFISLHFQTPCLLRETETQDGPFAPKLNARNVKTSLLASGKCVKCKQIWNIVGVEHRISHLYCISLVHIIFSVLTNRSFDWQKCFSPVGSYFFLFRKTKTKTKTCYQW